MIPNIVEPDPEPIQLFKDTRYSNTKTKRPIVKPVQPAIVVQNVKNSKRQKVNPVEPSDTKPPKIFLGNFAKTLTKELINELENNDGKPHKSKPFTADVVFRHVLPFVLNYYKKSQKAVDSNFFEHLR